MAKKSGRINVVVAHREVLYKQILASALDIFEDIKVVGQARFFDELKTTLSKVATDVVVAEEGFFTDPEQLKELDVSHIVLLTEKAEAAWKTTPRLTYFYTQGYLIDLYRAIYLAFENKPFAQPALIKSILARLRQFEETSEKLDALLVTFDKQKLSLVVDIIFGRSYEEMLFRHHLNENQLAELLNEILEDLKKISIHT